MFHLSRGFRCQSGYPFTRWDGRKSCTTSGGMKITFGRGEQHVLTISKTKGVPSASTNLKEALNEKIPVHHDLLRNFRRYFGPNIVSQITVENLYDGLRDVKTLVKETAEVDPKHGITYRGLTIPEVISLLPREGNQPSAEAVFWLLLTGDVPTQQQTASLIADWTSRRRKCAEWWSGSRGETIVSVLRSVPETITPLHKLSIALTIFDISKHAKKAKKLGAMPYSYWEYTYEDGMEFLATLPAIIGLIAKSQILTNVSGDGDWAQFLSECLSNLNDCFDSKKSSVADFFRLYVTLNADDDGGAPPAHIAQIMGSTDLNLHEILACSVLMYLDEPKTGTMLQWIELQRKIQSTLGRTWTENALEACVLNLPSSDKLIGHKEADFCDPRYTALLNYAREYLPDNPEIKFSQDIMRILRSAMKRPRGKDIYPEPSAMAATIFQLYGMKDMGLSQTILFMARALGAIAAIIWTQIVNAPVEHPIAKCTPSYIDEIKNNQKKRKRKPPSSK